MKIIDAHQHLGFDPYQNCKSDEYINALHKQNVENGICKAIVTIFPHTPEMVCANNQHHIVKVIGEEDGYQICCRECEYSHKSSSSPYAQANLEFLHQCKHMDWIIPYAVMIVSDNLYAEAQRMIEECPWVKGLKLYTGYSAMTLNKVKKTKLNLPLLIHTGIYENQNLDSMIEFIKNYEGPVQVAHFGRFDIKNIRELSRYDHVYFDCAPAIYLYQNQTRKLLQHDFENIGEMFYRIIDLIGIDKVVWGSDVPFGDIRQELTAIDLLSLSKSDKEKILYKNVEDRLGLA